MCALTSKGSTRHSDIEFKPGDVFVFGPETRGLPPEILEQFAPENKLRLPMLPQSRNLNLPIPSPGFINQHRSGIR